MKNNYLKKIMLIFPALFLIMSCIVPVKAYASTCPHAGSVSISTIKATCTKKGKKVVKCSRCGKVLSTQTTGNALGHKWKVEQKSATESLVQDVIRLIKKSYIQKYVDMLIMDSSHIIQNQHVLAVDIKFRNAQNVVKSCHEQQ